MKLFEVQESGSNWGLKVGGQNTFSVGQFVVCPSFHLNIFIDVG
jgi:hypothetical protein